MAVFRLAGATAAANNAVLMYAWAQISIGKFTLPMQDGAVTAPAGGAGPDLSVPLSVADTSTGDISPVVVAPAGAGVEPTPDGVAAEAVAVLRTESSVGGGAAHDSTNLPTVEAEPVASAASTNSDFSEASLLSRQVWAFDSGTDAKSAAGAWAPPGPLVGFDDNIALTGATLLPFGADPSLPSMALSRGIADGAVTAIVAAATTTANSGISAGTAGDAGSVDAVTVMSPAPAAGEATGGSGAEGGALAPTVSVAPSNAGAVGTVVVDDNSDKAIRADVARSAYGVDGTGLKIGILSDSFNVLGGYANDVANGDLPNNVTIVAEGPAGSSDEGRSMAELVHKVAPGAQLYFATAESTQATFAADITALKNAGCQIILDDFIYFAEPFYQMGDPVEQAIDSFVNAGGVYVTMAFNDGDGFYESNFNSMTYTLPGGVGSKTVHDFGGSSPFEEITTGPGGGSTNVFIQWEQPFKSIGGSTGSNDSLSLYVFDTNDNFLGSVTTDRTGGDPVQGLSLGNGGFTYKIAVADDHGPVPDLFKIVVFGDGNGTVLDGPGNGIGSGSITGHNLDPNAITVAAVNYTDTPQFGTTTPVVEDFSGYGPGELLFDANGNPLSTPGILNKPNIAGPDGSQTDPLNPFFGTSAATPNVGAVAALMLQANPSLTSTDIQNLMMDSAIKMADPDNSGAGLIQADKAVGYAVTGTITAFSGGNSTLLGTHLADTIIGGAENDVISGDGANGGHDTLTGGGGDDVFRDTLVDLDGSTITDMQAGDSIDATDLKSSVATATYSPTTGKLQLGSSTVLATLQLAKNLTLGFTTQSDGTSGTTIIASAVGQTLGAGYTGNENSAVALGGITVSATSTDALTAMLSVGHGTVSAGGTSGASITLSGTAAVINTALSTATFTGDLNYYGTDTLSLVTSDTVTGGTASGTTTITLADTTAVGESLGGPYGGNENSVVALGGITVSATPNTTDPLTATLSVSHGTVSAGGSSGASITLSGTAAVINTALSAATFTGDLNYYGPDTLSLVTSDTVNGSKASSTASMTLSDTTVVSENLSAGYTGNENSVVALGGITVSATPNTGDPLTATLSVAHGTVTAGGSSGTSITLSGTAAALNTVIAGATYTGDINYYGPDALSLVTSDTVNGSKATGSAAITLSDTTVVSESLSAGYTGNENSVVALGGISVSATPNASDPLTATLSVLHGTVSAGGSSGASVTLSGTAAAINTVVAGAKYTGDLNFYGTDSLSLVTSDTVNGSKATGSAAITLSDTTVVGESLGGPYSGNENSIVALGGITVSANPNTTDPLTATLSVSHGTVSAGGSSGASVTLSGTAAAINTALAGASFTGSANYYGPDTLSLVTSDTVNGSKATGSASITLSDTTVASENLGGPYSGNENSVVALGGITVSAAPNTTDPLTASLSVSHGTVSAGGSRGASITLSGAAAAVNAALAGATYTGDLNYYGPDTLSLVTSDTINGSKASGSTTITLSDTTAVSENVGGPYSGNENSVVALGGITVSAVPNTTDPLTATLSVAHGTVTAGGSSGASVTLSGTAAAINTVLAGATYNGDLNYYGSDTLSLVTSDTANGSKATGSASITLSDTTSVSESLSGSYSGNENSVVTLGGITVLAAPNTADPLTTTLSVTHGTVSAGGNSGASITLSGTAAAITSALSSATYTGTLNYYGPDTLSLVTSDTVNGSKATGSAAITLSDTTAVSESLGGPYSGNENSVVALGGITVSATPNTGDPLTATLSVLHGTVSAGGSSGTSITLSGTAAAISTVISGATYTGDLNYYGPDTLSLVTSDTTNGSKATGSATIALSDTTAVNETLGGPYSGNKNSVVALGGITVSATPNTTDPLTTTLGVSHGTVSAGGSSGASITLSGTAAAINTALAGATYTAAANYVGADTLSLATTDTTNGSSATGSAAITILTLPTITGTASGQKTTSQAPITPFAGVTVTDPNSGATETLTITLTGSGGILSGQGLSGGTGGVYSLSGSASAVTGALDALSFTPTGGPPNTAATTGFTLTDQSSVNVAPVSDSTTTVIDYNPAFGWSLINDPTSPAGEIFTFYEDIFGRAPDPGGFEHWVAAFENGESLGGIVSDFLNSAEYTSDFGPYSQSSDETFIDNIYRSALHRQPDPGGLQTYATALANGVSRQDVVLSIVSSVEARADLQPTFDAGAFEPDPQTSLFGSVVYSTAAPEGQIYALYEAILGRAPDPLGFENDSAAVATGTTINSLAQDLLSSAEYTSRFGANAQNSDVTFLTDLYQTALQRQPNASELQTGESQLANGGTRADAAVQIALSAEAQTHLQAALQTGVFVPDSSDADIARLYYGVLGRAPDAAGLLNYEKAADAGVPLVVIAADFLSSTEYLTTHAGDSDTQFLNVLYQNALGRAPNNAELQSYTSMLASPDTQTFDFNSLTSIAAAAGITVPALTPQLADRAFATISIVESFEAQLHLLPNIENGLKVV